MLSIKRVMEISTAHFLANQVHWVFESDSMNATQWVRVKQRAGLRDYAMLSLLFPSLVVNLLL